MKKDIERYIAEAVDAARKKLVDNARVVGGVKVVSAVLPIKAAAVKDLVFRIRQDIPQNLLCVIGSVDDGKPMLSVMLSDDMVSEHKLNAGQMGREAARLINGGGGGQPHFATAGGKNADMLSAAVDKVIELAAL